MGLPLFGVTVEPTGPDVDVPEPAQRRRRMSRGIAPVVAVVALGGMIGASASYATSRIWPTATGAFPWQTLLVNAVGCAGIGVFMVLITDVLTVHRLVQPFFGTGVLGGFTTFGTYAVDIEKFVADGQMRTGLAYMTLTLLAALVAVWGAVSMTRRVIPFVGREKAK